MLTLDGRAVLSLDLAIPRTRAWVATGEVQGGEALSGRVVFAEDGATVFSGTVLDSQSYGERTGFRIVGGGGGLASVVRAQSYRDASPALPIADILQQAGEELGASLEASVTGATLADWSTGTWEAARALDDLAEHLGVSWWVDALGGIRFGNRAAIEVPAADYALTGDDTTARVLTVAPAKGSEWALAPGCIVDGRPIVSVRFRLSASELRVECRYGALDLAGLIEAIVARHLRRQAYLGLYPATVHSQASDGTLQVFPDDTLMPGMVGVKPTLLAPGCEVRVAKGARVLVGFEAGDPARPFAIGWGGSDLESIAIDGGSRPFARVGDPVTVFLNPAIPVPVTGTLSGAPFVGVATFATPLAAVIGGGSPRFLG